MTITLTLENDYNNIYDCLDEFIKEDVLDLENTWKCDKCGESVEKSSKEN